MVRALGTAALSVLAGAVLLGTAWWAVSDHARQQRIAELERERAELRQVISRLKQARRVARLLVAGQRKDASGQIVETTVEFSALGRTDESGDVRRVLVPGDVCYIDALVVRFLDQYVEKGDRLRGHSIHLFRRIFGEGQRPIDGISLDEPDSVPAAYRINEDASRFERQLWKRFWQYARDPSLAEEMGVRLAQGEAVYQRLQPGQLWEVCIRADGGLEMKPMTVDPLLSRHLGHDGVGSPTQ